MDGLGVFNIVILTIMALAVLVWFVFLMYDVFSVNSDKELGDRRRRNDTSSVLSVLGVGVSEMLETANAERCLSAKRQRNQNYDARQGERIARSNPDGNYFGMGS